MKEVVVILLLFSTIMIVTSKFIQFNESVNADILCPDAVSICPSTCTCCISTDGDYSCCPIANGVCCQDRIHCCPEHYKCDLHIFKCDRVFEAKKLSMQRWKFYTLKLNLFLENKCVSWEQCPTGNVLHKKEKKNTIHCHTNDNEIRPKFTRSHRLINHWRPKELLMLNKCWFFSLRKMEINAHVSSLIAMLRWNFDRLVSSDKRNQKEKLGIRSISSMLNKIFG